MRKSTLYFYTCRAYSAATNASLFQYMLVHGKLPVKRSAAYIVFRHVVHCMLLSDM
jgi:hypothetical protein